MNNGLMTVTLMDCMAAMPCAAGRRARAFITKEEKAKKTPPINPQPSAEKSVKAKSNLSIILGLLSSPSFSAFARLIGEQGAENVVAPLAQRRRRRRLRRS